MKYGPKEIFFQNNSLPYPIFIKFRRKKQNGSLEILIVLFSSKKQLVIFNLCSPYFPNFCQLKIPLFLINTVTLKKHTFLKKEKTSLNRLNQQNCKTVSCTSCNYYLYTITTMPVKKKNSNTEQQLSVFYTKILF